MRKADNEGKYKFMNFIKRKVVKSNFSDNHFVGGAIKGSIFGALAGLSLLNDKEKSDKKKVLRNLLIGAGSGGLLLGGLEHYLFNNDGKVNIIPESIKKLKEGQ